MEGLSKRPHHGHVVSPRADFVAERRPGASLSKSEIPRLMRFAVLAGMPHISLVRSSEWPFGGAGGFVGRHLVIPEDTGSRVVPGVVGPLGVRVPRVQVHHIFRSGAQRKPSASAVPSGSTVRCAPGDISPLSLSWDSTAAPQRSAEVGLACPWIWGPSRRSCLRGATWEGQGGPRGPFGPTYPRSTHQPFTSARGRNLRRP